jgi:ABC-type transport system involved in multi-copper enzyme maturation permease subunit
MKYRVNDDRIKNIVDELGEEYKDLLIRVVLEENNEVDVENLPISDLIKTDIQIKERLKSQNRQRRNDRLVNVIGIVGILYVLLGFMMFAFFQLEKSIYDDPGMMISIVLAFVGFFIAVISIMMKYIIRGKENPSKKMQEKDYQMEIIDKWKIIEGLICQLVPEKENMSLPSAIKYLYEEKMLSEEQLVIIDKLRMARNSIVHNHTSNNFVLSQQGIKELLTEAKNIIISLNKLV